MITLIAAMETGGGIGLDNALPWRLPADMAHFKRTTMGKPVIMGRKTYESIGRALPGRRNITVTRNPLWYATRADTCRSLAEALELVAGEDVFVIGGAQVYEEAMQVADTLVITHLKSSFECDAFFPAIEPAIWAETAREEGYSLENGYGYAFVTYKRCQPKETQ